MFVCPFKCIPMFALKQARYSSMYVQPDNNLRMDVAESFFRLSQSPGSTIKYDAECFFPRMNTLSFPITSDSVHCKYSDARIQYVNITLNAAICLGFSWCSCSVLIPASSLRDGKAL
jgi:hypothetical protein